MRVSNVERCAAGVAAPVQAAAITIRFADFSRYCPARFASSASAGSASSPIWRSSRSSSLTALHPLWRAACFAAVGDAGDLAAQPRADLRSQRPPRRRGSDALRRGRRRRPGRELRRIRRPRRHRSRPPSPQLAVLVGAAAGALVSYSGQALFAFRPRRPAAVRRDRHMTVSEHDRRCRSLRDRRRARRPHRGLLPDQGRAAPSS